MRIVAPVALPDTGRHRSSGSLEARSASIPEGGERASRTIAPSIDLAQVIEDEAVLPRNRVAIAAYLAHQPSALERLGVELAGVDEWV